MKIFKYSEFLLESSDNQSLSYWAFDVDDNLIFLKTKIHMDELVDDKWIPHDVSTSEFVTARKDPKYRLRNNVPDEAFSEFRDFGRFGEDTFFRDVVEAVEARSYGPSWKSFIKCLVGGHIFAIITSRGHEPKNMRKAIEWIIYNCLSDEQQDQMIQNLMEFHELFKKDFDYLIDEYLNKCYFIGVQSKWFSRRFGKNIPTAQAKVIAFNFFANEVAKYGKKSKRPIKLSFSDDDPDFAEKIETFMRNELSLKYTDMALYVFHTSPDKTTRTKIEPDADE